MKVGDLVRPKDEKTFATLWYAIITKHDGYDVTIAWLSDDTHQNNMKLWLFFNEMEVVCK